MNDEQKGYIKDSFKNTNKVIEDMKAKLDAGDLSKKDAQEFIIASIVNSPELREIKGVNAVAQAVNNSISDDKFNQLQAMIMKLGEAGEQNADALKKQMDGLKQSLDRVEDSQKRIEESQKAILEGVTNLNNKIEKLSDDLKSQISKTLHEGLDKTSKQFEKMNTDLNEAMKNISNSNFNVQDSIAIAMKGMSEQLAKLPSEVKGEMQVVQKSIEDMNSRIEGCGSGPNGNELKEIQFMIENLSKNVKEVSKDVKEGNTVQESMRNSISKLGKTMELVSKKVDDLQTLTLQLFGELEIPRHALMVPCEAEKKKGMLGWASNKGVDFAKRWKFIETYKLTLLCEGPPPGKDFTACTCPDTEKGDPDTGFEILKPGERLIKMAPALILTVKMVSLALKAGKAVGYPLPSLPTEGPLKMLGEIGTGFVSMLDKPLEGSQSALYDKIGGEAKDKPTMSDLMDAMALGIISLGDKATADDEKKRAIQEAAKNLMGPGYDEIKKILLEK